MQRAREDISGLMSYRDVQDKASLVFQAVHGSIAMCNQA